nr:DNA circularization N-terminal domain-containing protein [Dyella lutea]
MRQASFRGVPFAVLGGDASFGRRVAVHEYPKRDKPYVEDLGRATRRIHLVGFLVENSLVYGGGSVIAQRDAMVAAAESAGKGTLVHPTLGELQVSIPDGGLVVSERWDTGRYFELGFSFIESGDRIFPSVAQSGQSLLGSLADALDLSAALDFVGRMTESINLGLGIVQGVISMGDAIVAQVVSTAAGFQVIIGQASRDATSLANLASLLTGNFGRYTQANVSSAFAAARTSSGSTGPTIASLTAKGAQDRQAVATASDALSAAASGIDSSTVSAFPIAAQALLQTLQSSIANPGDALRLLGGLAGYVPAAVPGSGQTVAGMQVAQDAVSALLRRAAIGALGRSLASFVPSSYDDAAATRETVTEILDAEILIAGDSGDDGSFTALRALRQSVVSYLTEEGANLARLETFTFAAPQPSLVLANRIYQDASRSDQLISQADPVHPAFMPRSFRALAN